MDEQSTENKLKDRAIVFLGEIMLRLTPPFGYFLGYSDSLETTFGGSEANIAVLLGNIGVKTLMVTALPSNPIGYACKSLLDNTNVDTSHIKFSKDFIHNPIIPEIDPIGRMGTYYYQSKIRQKVLASSKEFNYPKNKNIKRLEFESPKVYYDRYASSFSRAPFSIFDWDNIFSNALIFHVSGITPALSHTSLDLTINALKKAKEHSIPVFFDFNFRSSLWKYGKSPKEVIPKIMEYSTHLITNLDALSNMFPDDYFRNIYEKEENSVDINKSNYINKSNHINKNNHINRNDYISKNDDTAKKINYKSNILKILRGIPEKVRNFYRDEIFWAEKIFNSYLNIKSIIFTRRYEIKEQYIYQYACFISRENFGFVNPLKIDIDSIVDRVGAGDAFAAGIIYGWLNNFSPKKSLKLGFSLSRLKQMNKGDMFIISKDKFNELINNLEKGDIKNNDENEFKDFELLNLSVTKINR